MLNERDIRELMWRSVGLFRHGDGLREAAEMLVQQESALQDDSAALPSLDRDAWRRASLVTVASLIARAALRREETRGGHCRTDFPVRDDLKWKVHMSDVRPARDR